MSLSIQNLSPGAFAPFGEVIEQPTRQSDAGGPGWKWWGELVKMDAGNSALPGGAPYAIGFLDLQPAPAPGAPSLRFDWAERHMQTDELVVPLTGDCLVYVAPAEHMAEPGRAPEPGAFQVFRVRPGQAVLLKKGVWHGAPLADEQPANVLVILQHNTAKQDLYMARFEDQPLEVKR